MKKRRLEDMTIAELVLVEKATCDNPENHNPPKSFFLYPKPIRQKLDRIRRLITRKVAEKLAAEGRPVDPAGYSGRQSKRRR